MSKKNRAKSKAKRFGEGSAKPIVSAATYGVGGNAFAQAIADPVSTVHSNKPELLVVDGYNVIHCTPRYEKLVYDHSDDPYSSDIHDMARTALINDVAAFAQGRYEAVIVFDGAGNISNERPNLPARGVRIEFSPTGVSADTVVQKLCIEAREEGRACSVVSSDGTIQAVVMGKGVTRISSRMLVDEIKQIDNDVHRGSSADQDDPGQPPEPRCPGQAQGVAREVGELAGQCCLANSIQRCRSFFRGATLAPLLDKAVSLLGHRF